MRATSTNLIGRLNLIKPRAHNSQSKDRSHFCTKRLTHWSGFIWFFFLIASKGKKQKKNKNRKAMKNKIKMFFFLQSFPLLPYTLKTGKKETVSFFHLCFLQSFPFPPNLIFSFFEGEERDKINPCSVSFWALSPVSDNFLFWEKQKNEFFFCFSFRSWWNSDKKVL